MIRFYGVYLESQAISTVLELIRFLGEPDGIRFPHITLRGPYKTKMRRMTLAKINGDRQYNWMIEMNEPVTFFSESQSTVAISVDLLSLHGLVYKPDFPGSVPHITLYDGMDQTFARDLHALLRCYDWHRPLKVTKLRELARGDKFDYKLVPVSRNFDRLFQQLVGHPRLVSLMRAIGPDRRLAFISDILERCSEATPLPRRGVGGIKASAAFA